MNSTDDGGEPTHCGLTELKIGCARVCTHAQDLTAQRDALAARGVTPNRI